MGWALCVTSMGQWEDVFKEGPKSLSAAKLG